jgi:CRISPR-associated protein Csm3
MTRPVYRGRAVITGKIKTLTGLHIGAGKDKIEIGGLDLPVVRHPHPRDPYIPGSSLKGKLRFLLEWAFNEIRKDGRAWGFDADQPLDPSDPILRIFGSSIPGKAWKDKGLPDPGPTRLVARDAGLNSTWRDEAEQAGWELTEEKTEVSIDRIAGKALDGGLRRTERVVAGAVFDLEMVFRLYETDGDRGARDEQCLNWLLQGLDFLEQDALGGSGSRGYGRVRFHDLTVIYNAGQPISIDNRLRGHPFNREAPPPITSL